MCMHILLIDILDLFLPHGPYLHLMRLGKSASESGQSDSQQMATVLAAAVERIKMLEAAAAARSPSPAVAPELRRSSQMEEAWLIVETLEK